ncbi:MAG: flagellar basal body rod protein FlgC [Rhodospirillaceae bacterium]|nr:flagellar basal body rod protein FlgC [Rhodospirillaceae bacterium]
MDLTDSMFVSAAGLKAQGERLKVIAQNLANVDSLATTPGGNPYRRKMITFREALDRELGLKTVQVDRVIEDRSEFQKRLDPAHPAADADGYVKLPNVNPLIELADMREAQRSYEANLKAIEASRTMLQRTVDILR